MCQVIAKIRLLLKTIPVCSQYQAEEWRKIQGCSTIFHTVPCPDGILPAREKFWEYPAL